MKNLTKIALAAACSFAIFSGNVSAEGGAGSGPSPYIDCGIGGALFKNTPWAAAISNIIWDAGSTAITSATASPETCNGKDVAVAEFINRTYDNLIEDTAKGNGEYLTAVFDLYDCHASAQPAMTSELRSIVAQKVSAPGYSNKTSIEKSEALYFSVKQVVSQKGSSSCSAA
ncbi:MAG: DUF3015 family protein [Enterobacterales bacterium]|nr:DUF3015 family protein [Enterobacterales bacterium]